MRVLIICGILVAATPISASDVGDQLTRIANKYHVSPVTVHAVAEVESSHRCGARTGSSYGVMQVQRLTAKEVGVQFPFKSCEDEIEAGVKYLKLAIDKVGDNCYAYTLYNAGLYAGHYCSDYGRKVIRYKKQYEGIQQ